MQKNELEEKIISTARDIFIEKGYTETSMSDIAATLNINRPALHYYFRTKEKLFDAIFGEIIRSSVKRIHITLTQDESIERRLSSIIDSYNDYFFEHPDLPLFIFREIQRNSDGLIAEFLESTVHNIFNEVNELYASYIREGRIKDVPFITFLMTFYSLLICPFISRKLILNPRINGNIDFTLLLESWKSNILNQIDSLIGFRKADKK